MGDMADYDIDQGLESLALHNTGRCGEFGPCPYCDDADDEAFQIEIAATQRPRKKPRPKA